MESFLDEVDHIKYPEVTQKYRFEERKPKEESTSDADRDKKEMPQVTFSKKEPGIIENTVSEAQVELNGVNSLLLQFLDADSFYRKLEVITSNRKHMNDRMINDMAVSLDCTVEDGPLEERIQELIFCLQALCRFEDKRLR